MAPRNTRPEGDSRECLNCPNKKPKRSEAKAAKPGLTDAQIDQAVKRLPAAHGEKMWRHVMVGTSTCISMIEQYAGGNMPGACPTSIRQLRDRLSNVITHLEQDASDGATEE